MNPERAGRDGDSQAMPTINDKPCIQDLVIADLEARKAVGIKRYGTVLQPFNGRDPLRDLYEELLDACNYLRQAIYERANGAEIAGVDESGWRPMETAPRDGSEFFAYGSEFGYHSLGLCRWHARANAFIASAFYSYPDGTQMRGSFTPTRWQPIPAQPTEKS